MTAVRSTGGRVTADGVAAEPASADRAVQDRAAGIGIKAAERVDPAALAPPSTVDSAVRTSGLTKRFRGGQVAVDGIDLVVPYGSVYGFLGPNGSGKTTTIRMLLGLISATAGSAELLLGRLFSWLQDRCDLGHGRSVSWVTPPVVVVLVNTVVEPC